MNTIFDYAEYAPIVLIIICLLLREKIFVTPEQLERRHREIIDEVEEKFSTKEDSKHMSCEIKGMKDKIDKIYDKIMGFEQ